MLMADFLLRLGAAKKDLPQRSIAANALVPHHPPSHHFQLDALVMKLGEHSLSAVSRVVRDGTGVEGEPGEIQFAQVEASQILDRTHTRVRQTLQAPPQP